MKKNFQTESLWAMPWENLFISYTTKVQISLRIWTVWSAPLLFAARQYKSKISGLKTRTAHVVNRLLRENRKSIPIFFNGKKLFKNVTLQILNVIFVS